MTVNCAVYLRISRDHTGEGDALERQLQDAHELAALKGWTISEDLVYIDDSISAYRREVQRPRYNALAADYAEGKIDAIICYNLDRFTRQPRQLEDWIEAAETRGLELVTLNGECDLQTDGGRLFARMMVVVARADMERKSERQKRANRQKAERGQPHTGGPRPFGYSQDRSEVIETEAAAIREAARWVLLGKPISQVAEAWNALGLRSVPSISHGAPQGWTARGVRGVLIHPRYAARRIYLGQEYEGAWPAILDLETHLALVAMLTAPERRLGKVKRGRAPTTLLTGIARCGACGGVIRASSNRGEPAYSCRGKFCVILPRQRVDDIVAGVVIGLLLRKDELLRVTTDDGGPTVDDVRTARAELEAKLAEADELVLDGKMTMARYAALEAKAQARIEKMEAELAARAAPGLRELVEVKDPRAAWQLWTLGERRLAVEALLNVELLPRGRSRAGDLKDYVRVTRR